MKRIRLRRLTAVLLCLCLAGGCLPSAAAGVLAEPLSMEETLPEETFTEETLPEVPSADFPSAEGEFAASEPEWTFDAPYALYFGLLHAHTDLSDGLGSVEEAYSAAAGAGLDFFAVTDHSNSFDNAASGSLCLEGSAISQDWALGKTAAAAATTEDFVALFGFEMTWPEIRQLGHIVTLATPGWATRDQEGFADDAHALENYLAALTQVPGSVSQLCHPGKQYGDFERFTGYSSGCDDSVQLLEVLGEGSVGAYIQALDACWHLAPTASENIHDGCFSGDSGLRTVILADALTEDALLQAIRSRRVYATEDADFHIYYALDGHPMGSILSQADSPEIALFLGDPAEEGICTVEVIAEGGTVLTVQEAELNTEIAFRVPGGFRWYFLRLTQPDGDVAVTAPVWVEDYSDMGIDSLCADTGLPVQDRQLQLELTLGNREDADLVLACVEWYLEDTLLHRQEEPGTVAAGESLTLCLPYTHPKAGTADFRVHVRGRVLGRECSFEAALTLRFRSGRTVSGALIPDWADKDVLTRVTELLASAGMPLTEFSGPMPQGADLLLVPAGGAGDSGFEADALQFLQEGGSLLLWGRAGDNSSANRLLSALGSTLRLGSDTVPEGTSGRFNTDAPLCSVLEEGQLFRHPEGCSVDAGEGLWLVADSSGSHILLACEDTGWGGTVVVAGCPFLLDTAYPDTLSLWEAPWANQVLLEALFGGETDRIEEQSIRSVREADEGEICRIRGYITAGTARPGNCFPDTVYLQDDTGGIAVTDFSAGDIAVGTAVELIGLRKTDNGNPVLEYIAHRLPDTPAYRYVPKTLSCRSATDYSARGGQLVQVEGTVTDLTLTADGKGVARLTVKDHLGGTAGVEIEACILSGSTGRNRLAETVRKGRAVRCMGLLHLNSNGEAVLRVRNCDEVVYIPPKADPTNPKTADPLFRWLRRIQGGL